jgi:hypothetical protein
MIQLARTETPLTPKQADDFSTWILNIRGNGSVLTIGSSTRVCTSPDIIKEKQYFYSCPFGN